MSSEPKNKLSVSVWYKSRMLKWGIIAIIGGMTIAGIFFQGYSNGTKKYQDLVAELRQQISDMEQKMEEEPIVWDDVLTTEIIVDLIQSEIKDIGELATIEYLYTNAGKFEDPKKILDVNIPFTTKFFIAKWDGVIKAGVELDKIVVEINEENKEIFVHIPKAKILSHEIYSDSIETLDERDGLFNPVKVEDVREFDAVSKEAMEQRAIENGILDKAFENAKKITGQFVNVEIVQEQGYTIRFQTIES